MDSSLPDELLQEIFHRLPPPSSSAVSLVSKQWLRLYRSSKTHLSLNLSPHPSLPQSLSSYLSHFPFLSSLSLSSSNLSADPLLLSAASSAPNLRRLRLLTGPISLHPLLSLSLSCPLLVSLTISLQRPFFFNWVLSFPSLRDLSVTFSGAGELGSIQTTPTSQFGGFHSELQLAELGSNQATPTSQFGGFHSDLQLGSNQIIPTSQFGGFHSELQLGELGSNQTTPTSQFGGFHSELQLGELGSNQTIPTSQFGGFHSDLQLESLSLSGIRYGDCGFNWLWRSCKKLKKLQLKSCEGIGDGDGDGNDSSLSAFVNCLKGLQEIELRTCRSIVDDVLLKLAENCENLKSLLLYDGGSREGLLQFIAQSQCNLQKLDLRLPLDLENNHLLAMAENGNFHGLRSLRLQSCCLVTGEGLKSIGIAMSNGLEELALINCDVVEKEPGLLTTLGQNLKGLKKLDLSYNEMLVDKELISMLVSCNDLSELKLRGCKGLTGFSMALMAKSCKSLESIDITQCCGIKVEAIESFIVNARWLKQVRVEEFKVSDAARSRASCKLINDV